MSNLNFTATVTLNEDTITDYTQVREALVAALTQPDVDDFGFISDENGVKVGEWSIAPKVEKAGCSCGMGDFGTVGHDGDPAVPATITNGVVWVVGEQEFLSAEEAEAVAADTNQSVDLAQRINGVLYYTGDFDR